MVIASSIEGFRSFGDYSTWYRVTAICTRCDPLVVVHGGPGCSHDYLENLEDLAQNGRAVIHYDSGGGRSTCFRPRRKFWTVDLFLRELDNLLDGLDLRDDYHCLVNLGRHAGGRARRSTTNWIVLVDSEQFTRVDGAVVERGESASSEDGPAVAEILDCHEARGTTSDPSTWKRRRLL